MDTEEALMLVDELEELIETGGSPNPQALKRINAIAFRFNVSDKIGGYAKEKMSSIAHYADIVFSHRKFNNYGGYEKVVHILRMDCSPLRSVLKKSS
jgi:hypothetical protein